MSLTLTRREVPHQQEACYGSREHCCWHDVDEPDQGAFRCCLECRHVYRTVHDLVAAWDSEWPAWRCGPWDLPVGCAYCGHDF